MTQQSIFNEESTKFYYLEYQLKTYEEYFPIIEDLKDYILEDDSFLLNNPKLFLK